GTGISSSALALAAGDVDADGKPDIVGEDGAGDLLFIPNAGAPAITPTPAGPALFGTQALNTIGAATSFAIASTGAAALKVTSARSDSDDFVISGEDCVGETILAGATCHVRVRFAPTATGARSGNLTIRSNAASPTVIALSGTGGS